MALMQPVENGKIVETESQNSLKNKSNANNGMDKDTFLKLLVAQMQYQDPLEPTSNTEYISQYAQFSQVEQIQNMAASSDLARATQLVGKEVYVKTTTSTGDTKYIQGRVDYVVFENGKAYVSINEQLYSLEDVDTVVDQTYLDAYNKALEFSYKLNKLPAVGGVDLTDAKAIDELREIYEGMSGYEKTFLASDTVERYEKYVERLKEVRRAAGQDEFGNELKPDEGDGDENGDENVNGAGSAGGSGNVENGEDDGTDDETGDENDGSTEAAGEP